MPKLSSFELPFDLPAVDLTKFDLSTLDLSKIELPKFDLPKFDLPKVDVPELPSRDQVLGFWRDAAYAGTGLVAIATERIVELQGKVVEVVKSQVERVR